MKHLLILALIVAGCSGGPTTIAWKDYDTRHECVCSFGWQSWNGVQTFEDSCHFYRVGDMLKL